MVLGLQPLSDRVGEGKGEPILDFAAGEEMMLVQPAVAVALGRRPPESPGTLYISTKRIMWLSDADKSKGYAVDFLSISLHAVSRDPEAYPSPCIYTQIETGADESANSEDSDSEGVENVELSKITEMRLVPYDPSQLDTLFDIFCQCAELNPEPNEDGEEENSWFFGDEGLAADGIGDSEWQFSENLANPIGYANGNHDLARTVLEIETETDESVDSEDSDSEGAENVELSKITEMRLVPSDPSQLDTLFEIFCQCAELNPEPNEDGEEENSWFFGDEGLAADGIGDSEWQFSENLANPIGYANGNHDLARTVLELQINDQRFEDAEEMEPEPGRDHDHQ